MTGLATPTLWSWPTYAGEAILKLRVELGLSEVLAQALVARGLTDVSEVEKFLNPSVDQFHDPRLLPDYDQAVKAILNAKETGQQIYVHGDYDVDGVTSTALFTRFLKRIGCKVVPHVPHRLREGYGIHLDAVRWAKEQGSEVFLTCDCGVKAHEQIEAVREAGMVAVVTDHHAIGETLPEAVAVVNPHRTDSKYPFSELSGVGVVFKLCAGITQELGLDVNKFYRAYLDLAVLGTVADVMPLIGENRVITALGLQQLQYTRKEGLKALISVSQLNDVPKFSSRDIGYRLGPRINAVGRIDDPTVALDLLLTEDQDEAMAH
ncbi:MAG: DHH family phosphoesterase, partial [Armatimonadota bacterium]